jgi:hypothetical protein
MDRDLKMFKIKDALHKYSKLMFSYLFLYLYLMNIITFLVDTFIRKDKFSIVNLYFVFKRKKYIFVFFFFFCRVQLLEDLFHIIS